MSAKRQKNQLELAFGVAAKGEARDPATKGTEAGAATFRPESPAAVGPSMETIVARDNLRKALAQVRRNKGAPGIDGMTVEDLPLYLKDHWPTIRSQLLDGTYRPQPVLRVEIPKVAAGVSSRPRHPDGARPLHSAGGAAGAPDRLGPDVLGGELRLSPGPIRPPGGGSGARVHRGRVSLVPLDLEKFFDRVDHDIRGLVAKRVADRCILRLIRGFLAAGVLADGLVRPDGRGDPARRSAVALAVESDA